MRRARPLAALSAALVLAAGAVTFTVAGPAAAAGVADIKINEIESTPTNQGTDVRDWVELVNTGTATVNISGLQLRGTENPTGAALTVPSGTQLAAGSYYAIDTDVDAAGGFRIRDADTVRLLASDGSTQLDSYSWTTPASTTYGRCPNGTGPFVTTAAITKGTANPCGSTTPATPTATVTVTPSPAPVPPKDTTPPVAKVTGVKNNGFYPNKPPTPGSSCADANGVVVQCDVETIARKVVRRVIAWQAVVTTINAAGLKDTAVKNYTTPVPTGKG